MKLRTIVKKGAYIVLPLKIYLKGCYFYIFKKTINLDAPTKFTEKIYWLKIFYGKFMKQKMQLCYDKYTVREYLKDKDCYKYASEIYGIFNTAGEIEFDLLPEKFVIKITQSCGYNIFCVNKSLLDKEETIKRLEKWRRKSNSKLRSIDNEEGYFHTGNARIIIEEYLGNKNGDSPSDFRLYCFNGEVKFIICDIGTTVNGKHSEDIIRNVYDIEWNLLEVEMGRPSNKDAIIEKPKNLEKMINIAEKLSEDFPFVRVDLYDVDGRIVFGELTWSPMGGSCVITPEKYDEIYGSYIKLPNMKLF